MIAQRTDSLSLPEMLSLLREDRFGLTPEPYPTAYGDGYRGHRASSTNPRYMVGWRQGRAAARRGAHGGAS